MVDLSPVVYKATVNTDGIAYVALEHKKVKPLPPEIIDGQWTDNNNNSITKTILGDKVRFHIETKNIDKGTLKLTLRDWDGKLNIDDYPKGAPKNITINSNKGFIEFIIPKDWETDIEDDDGTEIELYFDIEYKGQTYELPSKTDDYLKVSYLPPEINKGWWTDSSNTKIKEALVGDVVRFHVETKNIKDSEILNLALRDWDGKLNIDDYPKGASDKLTVNSNKGYVEFTIPKDWESNIEDDGGAEIELYFDIKYKEQTYELPSKTKDYLNVYIKPVKITVIIELPMKNYNSKYSTIEEIRDTAVAKLGLLGHTAIAIENEYYDYGPEKDPAILTGSISESKYGDLNNDGDVTDTYTGIGDSDLANSGLNQTTGGPFGTLGSPWWDQNYASGSSSDIDLNDLMLILSSDTTRTSYGILGEVHIFELEVTEEEGKIVKDWWIDKYNNNLGIYSVNIMEDGDHCTSTVKDSLVEAKLIPPQSLTTVCIPSSFLTHMRIFAKNSAGKNLSKKAKVTVLKDLS